MSGVELMELDFGGQESTSLTFYAFLRTYRVNIVISKDLAQPIE